jgi:hypothetical protein
MRNSKKEYLTMAKTKKHNTYELPLYTHITFFLIDACNGRFTHYKDGLSIVTPAVLEQLIQNATAVEAKKSFLKDTSVTLLHVAFGALLENTSISTDITRHLMDTLTPLSSDENIQTYLNIIRHLLEKGAPLSAQDAKGRNIFHYAAIYKVPIAAVKLVLAKLTDKKERAACINQLDKHGMAPIYYALKNEVEALIDLLIEDTVIDSKRKNSEPMPSITLGNYVANFPNATVISRLLRQTPLDYISYLQLLGETVGNTLDMLLTKTHYAMFTELITWLSDKIPLSEEERTQSAKVFCSTRSFSKRFSAFSPHHILHAIAESLSADKRFAHLQKQQLQQLILFGDQITNAVLAQLTTRTTGPVYQKEIYSVLQAKQKALIEAYKKDKDLLNRYLPDYAYGLCTYLMTTQSFTAEILLDALKQTKNALPILTSPLMRSGNLWKIGRALAPIQRLAKNFLINPIQFQLLNSLPNDMDRYIKKHIIFGEVMSVTSQTITNDVLIAIVEGFKTPLAYKLKQQTPPPLALDFSVLFPKDPHATNGLTAVKQRIINSVFNEVVKTACAISQPPRNIKDIEIVDLFPTLEEEKTPIIHQKPDTPNALQPSMRSFPLVQSYKQPTQVIPTFTTPLIKHPVTFPSLPERSTLTTAQLNQLATIGVKREEPLLPPAPTRAISLVRRSVIPTPILPSTVTPPPLPPPSPFTLTPAQLSQLAAIGVKRVPDPNNNTQTPPPKRR